MVKIKDDFLISVGIFTLVLFSIFGVMIWSYPLDHDIDQKQVTVVKSYEYNGEYRIITNDDFMFDYNVKLDPGNHTIYSRDGNYETKESLIESTYNVIEWTKIAVTLILFTGFICFITSLDFKRGE